MLTSRLRSSWFTLAKLRWKPAPSGEIRCALRMPLSSKRKLTNARHFFSPANIQDHRSGFNM